MDHGTARPVLVTGASSGIGNCVAKHLAERGCLVYGTVRNDRAAADLRKIDNVVPLRCDVTKPAEIAAAVRTVTSAGHGLYGLVNNAGLGDLGMLSTWTEEEMLRIFDVNVFGPHRVTNAFLPLLLASHGRIVNIGSQGGILAKKYYGPYTMTKHAIEAYTETIRAEPEEYGVLASVVQPGGIATNIGEASHTGTVARFERAVAPFREEADAILGYLTAPPPGEAPSSADEAKAASETAESESNRSRPRPRSSPSRSTMRSSPPRRSFTTSWVRAGGETACSTPSLRSSSMRTTTRSTATRAKSS